MKASYGIRGLWAAWWMSAVVLLASCATGPKTDWASRVGSYTYDQAVLELGPPDKFADLTDGTRLAVWRSRGSSPVGVSLGFGVGSYGSHSGVAVGQGLAPADASRELQLTFDKDHRLTAWSRRDR